MASPFLLTVLDAEKKSIAEFRAGGPVERDLVAAITTAASARLPYVLLALQDKGRWWIRPAQFDAAMDAALKAALPSIITEAVQAVLLDLKLEVTAKHIGGSHE